MKIVRIVLWVFVAVNSIVSMILHIRNNKKNDVKWNDAETCAWAIATLASLNSVFLNLMLD